MRRRNIALTQQVLDMVIGVQVCMNRAMAFSGFW